MLALFIQILKCETDTRSKEHRTVLFQHLLLYNACTGSASAECCVLLFLYGIFLISQCFGCTNKKLMLTFDAGNLTMFSFLPRPMDLSYYSMQMLYDSNLAQWKCLKQTLKCAKQFYLQEIKYFLILIIVIAVAHV